MYFLGYFFQSILESTQSSLFQDNSIHYKGTNMAFHHKKKKFHESVKTLLNSYSVCADKPHKIF
jgi:hypothetical protein